jgi:glucokinase
VTKTRAASRRRAAAVTIGVDLGATHIKVGVLGTGGDRLLAHAVVASTEASAPVEVGEEHIVAAIRAARRRAGVPWSRVAGVGVGSPGTIDRRRGVILEPVNFSRGWFDFPICDRLSRVLGVPVLLENDANAFAFGEYSVLDEKPGSLVVLTLGTGLGSGLVRRGRIFPVFEAGHIDIRGRSGRLCGCGQRGCLEAYVSTTALKRHAAELVASGSPTLLCREWRRTTDPVRTVFELARAGDAECARLVDSTARALADGCRTIMHLHDPDEIRLAGGMAALGGDDFAARVEEYTRARVLKALVERTKVRRGALDPRSGWVGAAYLARERFRPAGATR